MGSHWMLTLLDHKNILYWPEDGRLRSKHVATMWPECIYITVLIYICVLTEYNTLYKFVTTQRDGLREQWRTEGGGVWGVQPPPSKFRRPSKIVPNSTRKLLKIAEFRTPTPQDVRKKGSKILKLPSVRSSFTLAMTNKLVVIINSLKVPKIKKILLYEMKFLVPNYSCLQNPWLRGYRPQIPVLSVLCPQLNFLNPPPSPRTKFLGTPLSVKDIKCAFCWLTLHS